jgi:hypothetical protein
MRTPRPDDLPPARCGGAGNACASLTHGTFDDTYSPILRDQHHWRAFFSHHVANEDRINNSEW